MNLFPSRNTFTFEKGMNITSDFDSGNLLKCTLAYAKEDIPCEKVHNVVYNKDEIYYSYNMWASPDAWPYMTETNTGRAGFFFAVSGFSPAEQKFDNQFNCDVFTPRTLRFHFKNLSNQIKLLSYGHMPVYLEVDNQTYLKLMKG